MSGNKMTVTVFQNTKTEEGYKIVSPEGKRDEMYVLVPLDRHGADRGEDLEDETSRAQSRVMRHRIWAAEAGSDE